MSERNEYFHARKNFERVQRIFAALEFIISVGLATWVSLGQPWWGYCYKITLAIVGMAFIAVPPRMGAFGGPVQPHGCISLIGVAMAFGAFWKSWVALVIFLLLAAILRRAMYVVLGKLGTSVAELNRYERIADDLAKGIHNEKSKRDYK